MKVIVAMLSYWILGCAVVIGLSIEKSVNEKLTAFLLEKANSGIRPIDKPWEQLKIHVIGALYQIVDLDQRNNLATISAYFDMWWQDNNLQWDPSEFDGTTETYLPSAGVWVPELYLYHSTEGSTPLFVKEAAVRVNYKGGMRIFVPYTAKALCPINVKYFPFDTQRCEFTFGSWSYKTESIEYVVASEQLFLDDFYDNQEWMLIVETCRLRADVSRYSTSFHNETYSTVVMELEIKREGFYYIFNLVIPTTLVTLVSVIGFHAPANAGPTRETKFRLGIMTLLSMGVMLLQVVNQMPKFSSSSIPGQRGSFSDVPLLGIFYISLIFIISLSTSTTALFVLLERYAYQNPDTIPYYLQWLGVEWCTCWPSRASRTKKSGRIERAPDDATTELMLPVEKDPNPHDKLSGIGSRHANTSQPDRHVEAFRSASDAAVRVPPLFSSSSTLFRYRPIYARYGDYGTELPESCVRIVERIADSVAVISQRLSNIQSTMGDNASKSSNPPAKGLALNPSWKRIIARLEYFSLLFYVSAVFIMLFLFFNPFWY